MGLDIALGIVVGIAAIRGWFKGFLRQAIPLGALVGCIYAADPLRDLGRPHAAQYFPKIGPEVMDRLLWWTAAALSYVFVTGVCLSVVKSMRKRTYGDPEPNRADQGAGFTLGALKGVIAASFLAAGVAKYAPMASPVFPIAEEQSRTSRAMGWQAEYQPAQRMWASPPVQALIDRVKTRGMWADPAKGHEAPAPTEVARPAPLPATEPPLRTASERPKTMSLPGTLDPDSPDFARRLREVMKAEGLEPADRP